MVELSSKLVSCGPDPEEDDDENGFVQLRWQRDDLVKMVKDDI